jgi:cytochrome c556
MAMRNFSWLGLAPAWLAVAGVGAAGASSVAQRLPAPEHVSSETRAELTARMHQHGETMSNLVRAVVLLDRPTIRTLAGRIADEEIIARASKAMRETRQLRLPREFFTEQTVLSGAARQLAAAAAEDSDDETLAERFSALTRTCIRCHSIYVHGRPEPQPFGPKTK